MSKRKIIVLGIDGLEYYLIEEWNLKFLKQTAYCKTTLSDFNIVTTPPIWEAMLTGRIDKESEKLFLQRDEFFQLQKQMLSKNCLCWNEIQKLFLLTGFILFG